MCDTAVDVAADLEQATHEIRPCITGLACQQGKTRPNTTGMAYRLTEADNTVDAVLQGVLEDTQQWADTAEASSTGHKQQEAYTLSELQSKTGAEHAPHETLAGTGQQQLTVPAAPTALGAPSHMPHVMSAMNPLFLPAKPNRPQSGQLQKTLSAMSQQLSALEHSMQQLPDEDAVCTPAGPLSAPSAELIATADSSRQLGACDEGFLCAACSSLGIVGIVQLSKLIVTQQHINQHP